MVLPPAGAPLFKDLLSILPVFGPEFVEGAVLPPLPWALTKSCLAA
jgi:hypothetical protein